MLLPDGADGVDGVGGDWAAGLDGEATSLVGLEAESPLSVFSLAPEHVGGRKGVEGRRE